MQSLFEKPARDPRYAGGTEPYRNNAVALALVMAIALVIIVAHAMLIPLGNWRYDEFDTFRHIREGGLAFVWQRIVGWSPRPLSEFLLYGYGRSVQSTGQSNVGLFLGLVWGLLAFGLMGPTFRALKLGQRTFWPIATLGASVFAMFLVGHRIDEVFYWAQGGAAYLPTLTVIAFIAFLHVSSEKFSATDHFAASCAAVVAALSSEMGASFAIVYGSLMLVFKHIHIGPHWTITRPEWSDLQFLLPVAAGLGIFYLASGGRLGVSFEAVGDPSIVHQLVPSLKAALLHTPDELLSLGPAVNGASHHTWGAIVAVAFCVGTLGLLGASGLTVERQTSLRLLVVCFAISATILISSLGAYYQFGLICCSRHETMRRCLAVVAAVSFAAFVYSLAGRWLKNWLASRWITAVSCLLVGGSMIASSLVTFPSLMEDLGNFWELRATAQANWDSGMATQPGMEYLPTRSKIVCSPANLTPGTYRLGENMPPHVAYIAKYFDKNEVIITGADEVCGAL